MDFSHPQEGYIRKVIASRPKSECVLSMNHSHIPFHVTLFCIIRINVEDVGVGILEFVASGNELVERIELPNFFFRSSVNMKHSLSKHFAVSLRINFRLEQYLV